MKPNNALALVMLSVATLISFFWFPASFVYISGILLLINAIISILMREISVIPILILVPSGLLYVKPWNLGIFVGLATGCLVGLAWKDMLKYHGIWRDHRDHSVIPEGHISPTFPSSHRPERRDFFLSYKSEDANLVRQVAECLVSNGCSVWFAEYEILLPNYDAFQAAIDNGLENCNFGILFTNPRYWDSIYCKHEAEWLRKNLNPEKVLDICLTAPTNLLNIISDIGLRTGLKLNCTVPQKAAETSFSARCTEIGFSTTGFCLEHWDNASVDGSDQARFRSLDPNLPLEFNVRFDFNLEYAPGKPHTISVIPVADDRKLYNERRVFAEWWMKEMGKLGAPPVEEGLHLVWREQRTHVALTHRFADLWMRKYSLIMDGPGLSRRTEVILTFAIKGDFRRFCTATVLMDRIVESVYITKESSITTTEKCKNR
jgi:hypothetical protein